MAIAAKLLVNWYFLQVKLGNIFGQAWNATAVWGSGSAECSELLVRLLAGLLVV